MSPSLCPFSLTGPPLLLTYCLPPFSSCAHVCFLSPSLSSRYVGAGLLLPEVMEPTDIIGARSTPLHRCYQSLAGLLMGLYPPEHRGE